MPSLETSRRLSSIGLFVLPVVAVKLASMVAGTSTPIPASANGGSDLAVAHAAPGTSVASTTWSSGQRSAAEHVRKLHANPFGPSPMLHTKRPEIPAEPVHEFVLPPEPVDTPIPQFALHGLISTSAGNKALIDGKQYLAGQRIEDTGWRVRAIDVQQRSVVLEELDGTRSVTLWVELGG